MCQNCITSFFQSFPNLLIFFGSFVLAGILFVILIKKKNLSNSKKLFLIYAHIFFLVFPIIFFIYGQACQITFLSCALYRTITYTLPIALGTGILISFLIIPFFYKFTSRSSTIAPSHSISKFITHWAKKIKTKTPKIFLLNLAKPLAFSFSNISARIFISVGLIDLLSQKELQAVLLHELGHIKQGTSFFKFSTILYKLISPLSRFDSVHNELDQEEIKADQFVIEMQKTNKYLLSAKRKINDFEKFEKSE